MKEAFVKLTVRLENEKEARVLIEQIREKTAEVNALIAKLNEIKVKPIVEVERNQS